MIAAVLLLAVAPDLAWTDLRGHEISLDDMRGRVAVVNFWATWCAPCIEEMPVLVDVQERYAKDGVQVLGVSADPVDERERVVAFADKLGINFPVVLGSLVTDMQALDVGMVLPATVVLDRHGHVAERFVGVVERAELEAAVERALDDDHAHDDQAVERAERKQVEVAAHKHDHDHSRPPGTRASLVPS